ncbi:YHS domain-containing (seleno)protein [Nisaea sp.]|uniref:YHS domain-containing (seleno)protein n=1 Tax=Nisaea sp. TaxID=2024842 RepID=UPI002B26809F|nr:YHS domain-containing (seleno)protein [Nisaea sp.]
MIRRQTVLVYATAATIFYGLALYASAAYAADEYNVSNGLTLTGNPLGVHGIDPTSLFGGEAARLGSADFTAAHDGVDYYFASAKTRDRFKSGPQAFLPQYGGFCALGVSLGKKLDGDVRYADIVDGKLYLFVNEVIFQKYLENKEAVLAGAKETWPKIRTSAVDAL